ncbi:MAG: GAF domain-containing sensor histidine kinase [Chloroflexi bacterium]|nr:GAF domain-containing sensor histidine kinase [Chloroflexota bacterium]
MQQGMFNQRLQAVTASLRTLQGEGAFQTRLENLADELEAIRAEFTASFEQTVNARAEENRRMSEAQQAFLLQLSDALRPLANPVDIQAMASRLLGEYLGVSRVGYAEFQPDSQTMTVERDWTSAGTASLAGTFPVEVLVKFFTLLIREGQHSMIEDALHDSQVSRALYKSGWESVGVRAALAYPIIKQERFVAALVLHQDQPRHWAADDISLIEEVSDRIWTAVERTRAEADLRASEHRQAFLLRFGDTLRSITNEKDILQTASRLLGEHLNADRTFFGELYLDENLAIMLPDYMRGDLSSLAGRYKVSDFQETVDALQSGHPYVIPDVANSELLRENTRSSYLALGYLSFFSVPLFKQGKLVLNLSAVSSKARYWTTGEIQLTQEVAERTWILLERVRAEAALRVSEERHAFLLRLTDTIRNLTSASEIEAAGCQLLGEHLEVDRAYYVEVNEDEGYARVNHNYLRGNSPSIAGTFRLSDYGWTLPHIRNGETVVVADAQHSDIIPATARAAMTTVNITSHITVPLIKAGKLMGAVCVTEDVPREWSQAEIDLVTETTERMWSSIIRASAEAAEHEQRRLAEGLRDTAVALGRTLLLSEVLETALTSAHRLVEFDAGWMVLTDKEKRTPFHMDGLTSKEQESLTRWDNKHGDIDTNALYSSVAAIRAPLRLQDEQIVRLRLPKLFGRTLLVVPLLQEEGIIGYLTLIRRELSPFSENEALRVQALAYQIVVGIQSAQRFEKAKELAVMQERYQIARDLHDSVTQNLFSANVMTDALIKKLDQSAQGSPKLLTNVHRVIQSAMAEMRAMLLELRPSHIHTISFNTLLQQLTQAALGRTTININLITEGEAVLSQDAHIALYRITQEAINNAIKHSGATELTVVSRGDKGSIDLQIRDNGQGFSVEQTSGGMGMDNMRERAEEAGARLTIQSSAGAGTVIHIVWP